MQRVGEAENERESKTERSRRPTCRVDDAESIRVIIMLFSSFLFFIGKKIHFWF